MSERPRPKEADYTSTYDFLKAQKQWIEDKHADEVCARIDRAADRVIEELRKLLTPPSVSND